MATKTQGHENRRSQRIEVRKGVWVAWRTTGAPTVSRVTDLSVGGTFISTKAPLPRGSAIQLLFSLPEGEVRIDGVVRFSKENKGMGIEFKAMGMADRARLQELMRRLKA